MIRVKKVILRNTSILLKDEKSLEDLRVELGILLDIDASQITFTYDELAGTLEEDDPCLKQIKKLKEPA